MDFMWKFSNHIYYHNLFDIEKKVFDFDEKYGMEDMLKGFEITGFHERANVNNTRFVNVNREIKNGEKNEKKRSNIFNRRRTGKIDKYFQY